MEGCCVIRLRCGGSGVFTTLGSFKGGVNGSWNTGMLKMAGNFFSAAVCFYTCCGMGLYGSGLCRSSVRSFITCVIDVNYPFSVITK